MRGHARYKSVADPELPNHRLEPLLRRVKIHRLHFCAFEIGRERAGQLRLQLREPLREASCPDLVPKPDERVVERLVEVHQMDEPLDVDAVRWVFLARR